MPGLTVVEKRVVCCRPPAARSRALRGLTNIGRAAAKSAGSILHASRQRYKARAYTWGGTPGRHVSP